MALHWDVTKGAGRAWKDGRGPWFVGEEEEWWAPNAGGPLEAELLVTGLLAGPAREVDVGINCRFNFRPGVLCLYLSRHGSWSPVRCATLSTCHSQSLHPIARVAIRGRNLAG